MQGGGGTGSQTRSTHHKTCSSFGTDPADNEVIDRFSSSYLPVISL